PEMVERLLRPFERGDAARSEARGAGLGLAIVERIARLHRGELRLLANRPHGLRVELRLPAQAAPTT
ncbi:MAG TPA: ATP-binding protein, partial [Burkholderiaceae bacterium]|nr:ATP-binding protein [Burkholderiaceae bacterium]